MHFLLSGYAFTHVACKCMSIQDCFSTNMYTHIYIYIYTHVYVFLASTKLRSLLMFLLLFAAASCGQGRAVLRIEVRWWDFYKRRWTTLWLMRNVYTRYKAVLEHLRGRNRAHKGSEALGSYMSEGGGARIFQNPAIDGHCATGNHQFFVVVGASF